MKAVKGLLSLLMKFISKQFIKFAFIGGFITLITYILYLMLLTVLSYNFSYAIAYICGIVISYFLNSIFVFHEKIRVTKMIRFPFVYVVQYVLNSLLFFLFVEHFGIDEKYALFISILLTFPLTYLLSRHILKDKGAG